MNEYTRAPFLLVGICLETYRLGIARLILCLVGKKSELAAVLRSKKEVDGKVGSK